MCRAADRLAHLCLALNLTPQQFATRLDLPLHRVLRPTRRPSDQLFARVLRAFPEVSATWLCLGEGELLRATGGNTIGINYGTATQAHYACTCTGTISALQAHLLEKERLIQLLQYALAHESYPRAPARQAQ